MAARPIKAARMNVRVPAWPCDHECFADALLQWMQEAGGTNYDPSVTQFEHALQSAALAAAVPGASKALIAAAFLHDVGHLLAGEHAGEDSFLMQDVRHELIGASWLSRVFGPDVTEPVRLHVDAKRYLCTTDAGYHERLSASSKRSFEMQGGGMCAAELARFHAQPHAEAALLLRQIDDTAKVKACVTPPATAYRPVLIACIGERF